VGFPIRKSAAQSSFAAPRGLSQRSTSFIASQRQGIHQMPLRHLIALIINAHPSRQMARDESHSQRRTLIRKTSLLHKIDPTAMRSSFADVDIAHGSRRGNIGDSAPRVTHVTRRSSDRSPLHDVRHHGRSATMPRAPGLGFSRTSFQKLARHLVEPDGIEPTTSCLQSRRSPN
jgi:hypothetical protein